MNADGHTAPPSSSGSFVQRGGLWVLGQAGLMLAVFLLALLFHASRRQNAGMVCGVILFVLGGICGIAGAVVLRGGLTPLPKPGANTKLVRHGIYGLMRHPLYTSVILASLGWALIWQSWPALLAALVLGLFFDAKARREERWLREKFPEYADYARRVRRFIPWVY